MYELDEKVKKSVESRLGIPFAEIINMDYEDIEVQIKKKQGKALKFSMSKNPHIFTRGNRNVAERRYHFFGK
jgi:hypothetical protein